MIKKEMLQRKKQQQPGTDLRFAGGEAAKREYSIILSEILKNPTHDFLERTGIRTGMHGMQPDCGAGSTTFQIAQVVGAEGSITGWDASSRNVEIARQKGMQKGLTQAMFECGDINEDSIDGAYDFIFHRALFGFAIDLDAFITALAQKLRPGGVLLIEMIDLTKHYCHPFSYAYEQYREFVNHYIKTINSNQINATILSRQLNATHFQNTRSQVIRPTFLQADGRKLAALILESISPVVIDAMRTTKAEVSAILDELKSLEEQEGILMSLPSIYQVCAIKK